jgi:hypothetical protein
MFEELSAATVAVVEVARVSPVKPLHARRKRRIAELDQEVHVVRHQAERQDDPPGPLNRLLEERDVPLVVLVVDEERRAFDATRPDVHHRAGVIRSLGACH